MSRCIVIIFVSEAARSFSCRETTISSCLCSRSTPSSRDAAASGGRVCSGCTIRRAPSAASSSNERTAVCLAELPRLSFAASLRIFAARPTRTSCLANLNLEGACAVSTTPPRLICSLPHVKPSSSRVLEAVCTCFFTTSASCGSSIASASLMIVCAGSGKSRRTLSKSSRRRTYRSQCVIARTDISEEMASLKRPNSPK
mmetsp:Transcript_6435/g.15529  ORF Transcript_6435/g.15529 Transcript_6435/m.15529 type:complete len:200 (+) Transcript_6435:639-1238(+)